MRGDFARLTFDPSKHYTGVLHQQGRVWLEADWNEDILDRQNLLWQETFDIIGACGVPDPGTAFKISPNPDPASQPFDFLIAGGSGPQGRYYVDGILCQLEHNASYLSQPDFPDAPTIQMPTKGGDLRALVYLEVWQRLITYLEDDAVREVALGGPDTATRLKTIAQVKVLAATSDQDLTCATAELPESGHGTLTTIQPKDSQPDELCSLPDPSSYTGRENHLYRVEIHDRGDVIGSKDESGHTIGFAFNKRLAQDAAPGAVTLTLQDALSQDQLGALKRSGVVSLVDDDGQTEIVAVSDASTDTSATHLTLGKGLSRGYSVAKNAAVIGGVARFKWSRDNASFAVRVTTVSGDRLTLTLASLGRDQATALRDLDLVEFSDDASDLGPARGHLTYLIADPDPDQFTVSLADPLPDTFSVDRHLLLRRWDGWGWANANFDAAATPDMDLGDGVHIHFGGWDLRSGDFWQFAARSADGSVEPLTDAPPFGILRHACPLAIVKWDSQVLFNTETILNAAKEIGLTNDQLSQLEQKLKDSGKTLWNASEVETLIQSVGATSSQISTLSQLLARLSKERDPRLTFTVLEDCRQPFDPLTKRCCDCTVTVAPGESLSAAFDKIRDPGGIVCLLPGVHELTDTVTVSAKKGLTIRGAGAATIITAPTTAVALRFESCVNLTLRDLTISSGQQQPSPGPSIAAQPNVEAGTRRTARSRDARPSRRTDQPVPESRGGLPFEGVVTFVDCQVVSVSNCIVICNMLAVDRQTSERSCIVFAGSNFLPQSTQVLTGFRASNKTTLREPRITPPASTPSTPTRLFLEARASDRPLIDFTLRNCRLYVDAGQIGLVVAGCTGVAIEDNWCLCLTVLTPPGLDVPSRPSETAQVGLGGMGFFSCRLVTLMNNLLVGLSTALFTQESHNLTIRGNTILETQNIDLTGVDVLHLSENVFETQDSMTLFIENAVEVNLIGNELRHVGAKTTQQFDSVAFISAETAIISNNSFFTDEQQLVTAVTVTASSITYTANHSVCTNVPGKANVVLQGLLRGDNAGCITTVSNTCREPQFTEVIQVQARLQELNKQLQDLDKQQNDLVTGFLNARTGDAQARDRQRQQFEQQIHALNEKRQGVEQTRNEIILSGGGGPISLLATAGAVVTGLNLLSNNLVKSGANPDEGSIIFGSNVS